MSRVKGSLSEIKRARRAAKNEKARSLGRGRRARQIRLDAADRPRAAPKVNEDDLASSPRRIAIVGAALLLAGAIVLGRAAELQLLEGDVYGGVAERQASTLASINAKRGVIEDRHGAELAITVDVDSVYAEPRRIDPEQRTELARSLAGILEQPADKLLRKLAGNRAFVYLARRVDPQVAARVRALNVAGAGTMPEPKRFYSNRELAAHVLGFSSWDGEGGAGIEKQFDAELRGKSYEVPGLRDALGNKVFTHGFVPHAVLEGADVHLTIDRQIQYATEEALAEAVKQFRARAGVAIVLEVKTGEVLSLASWPTYNPNSMKGATADHQLNRAVSAVYEPGSTMKMVTIAGALEDQIIRATDRVDCEKGRFRIGRRTIGDSHKGYGELTIGEVMKVSSNVCAAKIGMQLGRQRLHHWLLAFGLGEKTEIELPGELRGLIRPPERWRDIALANIAFGQGISVTPLQIAQATAVVANDGKRIPPRIVREIVDKSGRRIVPERPTAIPVLSEKTAREVTAMMEEVTKKGGTAEGAAIPGFRVAGKTGTAQKIDPVTKAYSHELYISSFAGFVPADRPDVAILVMIDEPKGAIYGGTVAAPAWRKIAVAALTAREVFPEDEAAREAFLASYRPVAPPADARPAASDDQAPVQDADTTEEMPAMRPAELEVALSAEAQALLGLEVDRAPKAGPQAERSRRMPNFAGLELREVLNRSADVRCDPVLTGTGRVVSQSPRAGDLLPDGARCELTLSPNG